MKIAIVGDFNSSFRPHAATNEAIDHARRYLGLQFDAVWIPTDEIMDNFEQIVNSFQGFWIAPGSPYKAMEAVLEIIKYGRINHIPTFGTCAGFQHMAIEFARNVLNIPGAQHAEYEAGATALLINPLSCPLAGQTLTIAITEQQSRAYKILNSEAIKEKYYCKFGLNPQYQADFDKNGFNVVGTDETGEARILELRNHEFFIGTLFVPQDNSTFENPHRLVTAFISAAAKGSLTVRPNYLMTSDK